MAEKKQKTVTEENTSKKTKKESSEAKSASKEKETRVPSRLGMIYKSEIIPALMKKFNYKSEMQVPKIVKVVVNMGVGEAVNDQKILEQAVKELETIVGQKASIRKAKKSISNFKLREGVNIGAMVTLRKDRMYELLDRLINIALPRVRDFKGLSDKSFDGRGNYTLGIKEQIIFPEINADRVTKVLGMDITIVTTAKNDSEAFELLQAFGIPFRKKELKTA